MSEEKYTLFTMCPEAEKMWDYSKNLKYPSEIQVKSKEKVNWICQNGHSFPRSVYSFVYQTKKCPECQRLSATVSGKSHMMKFWDFEKNKGVDVTQISAKSKDFAFWICPKCGYDWDASIRTRKTDVCPCCDAGMKIGGGINDFSTVLPELALDYDEDLNPGIDITILGIGSHDRLKWKCHICGHVWKAPIYSRRRIVNNSYEVKKCPVCAKNKRAITFAEQYPGLVDRFLEKENGCKLSDLKGTDYGKMYKWTCEKHGSFDQVLSAMIRAFNNNNNGCSYCHGRKVKHEESFGAKHPDLVKEWSNDNELSPFEYTENSKQEVEWTCDKGHKWKAALYTRSSGYGYCRECFPRGKNSRAFSEIYPELKGRYSEKNKILFEGRSCYDTDLVVWKCSQKHEFLESFYNIHQSGRLSCNICNFRKIVPGINDLQTIYPDIARDYDAEKNEINVDQISPKSSDEDTYWICKKGHHFQRSVRNHVIWQGVCPVCSRHVLVKGENDLLTAFPEIYKVWDYNKNEKRPEDCFDTLINKYQFSCEQGHNYRANVRQIVDHEYRCLVCEGIIAMKGTNSLLDTHPELAKEWSSNNYRIPDECIKESSLLVEWVCQVCGGSYSAKINEREVGDDSCPYCNYKRILVGFNDLSTTHPELVLEWSLSNNRNPEGIMKTFAGNVKWVCPDCNGEYSASVINRESGDDACPYCNSDRVLIGYNDLATTNPELAKEWSSNNDRGPETITKAMGIRAFWKCPECQGEYVSSPNNREVGDDSCPYCRNDRALIGYNDLATTNPELALEWSQNNERGPETVTKSHKAKVNWNCPECGGEYAAPVFDREAGDDSCPYCRNDRILIGYNDLATTNPELALEWSQNNERGPETVMKSHKIRVNWNCPECGGEYLALVFDREAGDDSCPYCTDKKPLAGFNTFYVKYPVLMKEWAAIENYLIGVDANDVTVKYNKDVWWECPKCRNKYHMTINDRVMKEKRGHDPCPKCSGRRQKKIHYI